MCLLRKTSQLVCFQNPLAGFHMIKTPGLNVLFKIFACREELFILPARYMSRRVRFPGKITSIFEFSLLTSA